MTPTSVALWSLGILLVLKIVAYFIYRHLSRETRNASKTAHRNDADVPSTTQTEREASSRDKHQP